MARNMYKSAMATGLASGKMRASMYDMASLEGQKRMEDVELSLESEKLNRNIGLISDTLSLASTVAGRYGDISEDVSTIESKYGEMEQPEGMFGKMIQSAKIGLGVGEYKFGEETIAAKDIASTAAKVTQQSMFDEAMKTINVMDVPDKSILDKIKTPKKIDVDIETSKLQSDNSSILYDDRTGKRIDVDPTKMTDDEFMNFLNLELANEK